MSNVQGSKEGEAGMSEYTTIRIDRELHEQLKALGGKGESYSEIIRRLIQASQEANKQ